MTGADGIAIAISVAAFGFSIYAWVRQFSITRRLAAIEVDRRGEELAAKASAGVSARIRQPYSARSVASLGRIDTATGSAPSVR